MRLPDFSGSTNLHTCLPKDGVPAEGWRACRRHGVPAAATTGRPIDKLGSMYYLCFYGFTSRKKSI